MEEGEGEGVGVNKKWTFIRTWWMKGKVVKHAWSKVGLSMLRAGLSKKWSQIWALVDERGRAKTCPVQGWGEGVYENVES